MATQSRAKSNPDASQLAVRVQNRYADVYRAANSINGFGQAIKLAGLVVAVVIFAWAANALSVPGAGVVAALIIGAIFFVIGIVVAAQGQMLKAVVDAAVNSSPFLNVHQKATVMFLSGTIFEVADDLAGAQKLQAAEQEVMRSKNGADTPFCYHCGAETSAGAAVCGACGKQL